MFDYEYGFSSPCLGILFSLIYGTTTHTEEELFSSPCLGILFSQYFDGETPSIEEGFRPHVWGFFFHLMNEWNHPFINSIEFSSPCLGILFSQNTIRAMNSWNGLFSSPCLGILFSRCIETPPNVKRVLEGFRPHVWGFFFHFPKN